MKFNISIVSKLIYVLTILGLVLLGSGSFIGGNNRAEAEQLVEYGIDLDEAYRFQEAETQFTSAIELAPQYAEAYGRRCEVRYQLGNYDGGLEDCNRALRLNPSLMWVYGQRCLIYSGLEEFDNALNDCEQAVGDEVSDHTVHNNLGILYSRMGDTLLALEQYNLAIGLDRNNSVLHYNRGRAYSRLEDYPEAIEDFRLSLELDNRFPSAHRHLITALYDDEQFDSALEAMNNMIDLFPEDTEAYIRRANHHLRFYNYDLALVDATKAFELGSDDPYDYVEIDHIITEILKAYCSFVDDVEASDIDESVVDWIENNGECNQLAE